MQSSGRGGARRIAGANDRSVADLLAAGTGLAWLVCRYDLRLHWPVAIASVAVGLFLFGYLQPRGAYSAVPVVQDSAGYRYDRILVHTLAGWLILLGLITNNAFGQTLSVRPLRFLGRLSFPIYLFCFPLLCSLARGVFLLLQPTMRYPAALAVVGALYVPTVFVVGFLFARLNEVWAAWVNRSTDRVLT